MALPQASVPLPALSLAHAWESVRTWANLATLIRTAVAVPIGMFALVHASAAALIVAYAVYWLGDMLDGWLARRLDQETRIGAVLDIVSDRACCGMLIGGLAVLQPQMWPALALYFSQFMVLDCALSLSFLSWPLLSPNYFYRVDRAVWRLNWSPPAKAINTVAVVLAVASGRLTVALAVALSQLAMKTWSAHRVLTLPAGR